MRIISENDIERFREYLLENEKSNLTVEKYLRDVMRFAVFAGSHEICKTLVLDYKTQIGSEYAVSSANSMLASLNAFFRFMCWNDLSVRQFKVQKKVFCEEEKELSRAEYERLCNAARKSGNERLELILQTLCGTGIRVSELKFITVEAVRRSEAVVSCKNKTRTVFIVRELCKKLSDYCRRNGIGSGCIFVTKSGKPLSRVNVWREMKALCKAANVDSRKVFPHNLRHLFARVFYAIEKDIAKLADILGHSSVDTTRIYIISTGIEHRQRMETMHLIL